MNTFGDYGLRHFIFLNREFYEFYELNKRLRRLDLHIGATIISIA